MATPPSREPPTAASAALPATPKLWSGVAVGDVLDKRFKILAPISSGGTATVYRCEDLHLRAPAAVKILTDVTEDARLRFLDEARVVPSPPATPRFDTFALGVTLYLLCTGVMPNLAELRPMNEVCPKCEAPLELEALVASALAVPGRVAVVGPPRDVDTLAVDTPARRPSVHSRGHAGPSRSRRDCSHATATTPLPGQRAGHPVPPAGHLVAATTRLDRYAPEGP